MCGTITPFSSPLLVLVRDGRDTLFFINIRPPFSLRSRSLRYHSRDRFSIYRMVYEISPLRKVYRGLQGKKRDAPGHVNRENQVRYILSNE